jgi:DNA topoisomerase-1
MTAFCDKYKIEKRLVIVESPAKCDKIEEYLGGTYKCIASYGHLCTIASIKDIDIANNFEPTYTLLDDPMKAAQIKKIKEEIAKADEVILASDNDREGEAIAFHICRIFGLPLDKTKRIIFHEITKDALLKAVTNPTTVNMNMVRSQQARQVLDVLVGFTVSPVLWKLIQANKTNALSAGRCQTPALKLVYENNERIKATPGKKVYSTVGYFTKLVLPFSLTKEYENEEDMEYFIECSVNHDHIFTRDVPKASVKVAPKPFTTSRIQQAASNELHYSPKETMKLCQTLYEAGLITYMRTDSDKYSAEFVDTCKKYIVDTYNNDKYISPAINAHTICSGQNAVELTNIADGPTMLEEGLNKRKKTGKPSNKKTGSPTVEKMDLVQAAHEAIRPTNILCTPGVNISIFKQLSTREIRMYEFIWTNSLESLMADSTFSSFKSNITAAEENVFVYHAEQVVFPGWLIVANKYEKESKEYAYLMALKQGATVEYKKIEARQTIKSLQSHYTEARLVSLLEDHGIGRPSTYASIVDKIQQRNYVKKEDIAGVTVLCKDFTLEGDTMTEATVTKTVGNEKNKLVITPVGIIVMEFLLKYYGDLFNYDYTKTMELRLDMIATEKEVWHTLCGDCYKDLLRLTRELKGLEKLEYVIDENHVYIIGKNGPVIKCNEAGTIKFKQVRANLDMGKLERGEYQLEEVVEEALKQDNHLGKYKGDDLIVKKGKYGLYATYGENRLSLAMLGNRPVENITYAEVFKVLEEDGLLKPSYNKDQKRKGVLREISSSLSIREGKWGPYVYYKTTQMKTPKFFELKQFEKDTKTKIKTCELNVLKDWIKTTHNVG